MKKILLNFIISLILGIGSITAQNLPSRLYSKLKVVDRLTIPTVEDLSTLPTLSGSIAIKTGTDDGLYWYTGTEWQIIEGEAVDLSNYVTLDGTQTITGYKTFTQYVNSSEGYRVSGNEVLHLTDGSYNLALGRSGDLSSQSSRTILIGYEAGRDGSDIDNSVMIGYQAGAVATTLDDVIYIGRNAGWQCSGDNNIGIGNYTMQFISTGEYNIGIGRQTLTRCNSDDNITIGNYGLSDLTTGDGNIGIGDHNGDNLIDGVGNILVGQYAGQYYGEGGSSTYNLTNIDNCILIGANSKVAANDDTNEIVIGDGASGNGSNTTTIGNASTTDTYLQGNIRLDTETYFSKDGSNNLTFTDEVSGTVTLASLIGGGSGDTPTLQAVTTAVLHLMWI